MANVPVVGGSISFTSPSYNYGDTSQAINGGYSFDLPLATIQTFTQQALDFSAQNSVNAQGFFSAVLGQSQSNLTNVTNQTFGYMNQSLGTMKDAYGQAIGVQNKAIKKKFSGCFITTAVTKAEGLPDDNWKLQLLRKFRDEVLAVTEDGQKLIDRYYQVAPVIVEAIDKLSTSGGIYAYLLHNFIDPAIQQISVENFDAATGIYSAMVEVAHNLAGSPELPEVSTEPVVVIPPPFHPLGD